MNTRFKKLGALLVDEGILTSLQLSIALAAQKSSNARLGAIIVEKGFASESQIAHCLAEQYGYAVCDPLEEKAQSDALAVISAEDALARGILPLRIHNGELLVAMADPIDVQTTDEITNRTGLKIQVRISPVTKLEEAIKKAYSLHVDASGESCDLGLDRYRESRLIERFGDATLYTALDTRLRRTVSLFKVPKQTEHESGLEERIRAVASTSSNGLAAIYDFEDSGDAFWTVYEPLNGESLRRRIGSSGSLPLRQASEIAAHIADGIGSLNHAHSTSGLVCPSNVILLPDGRAVLTGFVSPESSYSRPVPSMTGQEAIFAVGALLFESHTGKRPNDLPGWPERVDFSDTPLPLPMQKLLWRCFSNDASEQFANPAQLRDALRAYSWQAYESGTVVEKTADQGRATLLDFAERTRSDEPTGQPKEKPSIWGSLFGRRSA